MIDQNSKSCERDIFADVLFRWKTVCTIFSINKGLVMKSDSSTEESLILEKKKLFKFYLTVAVKVINKVVKT